MPVVRDIRALRLAARPVTPLMWIRRIGTLAVAGCSIAAVGASSAVAPLLPPAESLPPYVLAYTTGANSSIVDAVRADGTAVRQLVGGNVPIILDGWSPDGSRLVYEALDATRTYTSIFTVGLDGAPPIGIGNNPYDEDASWSPDGRWLAFQTQTDFGSGGGRADTTFDLLVAHPNGSGLKTLGSGGVEGSSADWVGQGVGWAWAPNSRWIAFAEPDPHGTDESGDSLERLAVADVVSGHVRVRIAPLQDPQVLTGWAWSSDGRRIGFVRDNGVAVLDVVKRGVTAQYAVAGGTALFAGDRLPLSEFGVGWNWSPTESLLGIVQRDLSHRDPRTGRVPLRLAVVDTATRNTWIVPGNISTANFGDSSLATADTGWVWSPDGTKLALLRHVPGSVAAKVLIADVRHHSVRFVGHTADHVAWSPDGRVLAVSSPASASLCGNIRLVDAATGQSAGPSPQTGCDQGLAWSPDNSLLAFTRMVGPAAITYTLTRDGSQLQQVVPGSQTDFLRFPAQCGELFSYGDNWILYRDFAVPRIVPHPSWGDAQSTALRCW